MVERRKRMGMDVAKATRSKKDATEKAEITVGRKSLLV